ncbi:MAG: glycosyltransferase [Blastocatellia bacterium]|nr:glycosyltransferase [Blastocatellia bacterium]
MNLLVLTSLWPNAEQPDFSPFVRQRIAAIARSAEVRVVAPVPYFPRRIRSTLVPAHWRRAARIPMAEEVAGFETAHPRWLATPRIGMRFYSRWMARAVEPALRRMHAERPIDLIDAHYVYPDGHAAVLVARRLGLPVVITARGSDVHQFSEMAAIRPLIREALAAADGVIAVSGALRRRMVELGIPEEKIAVIRNGIDGAVFAPRDRAAARRRLGVPAERRMLLSVGHLVPVKGFDRLIDAMDSIEARDVALHIVGEGPERPRLAERIRARALQDRVFLPGARPHAELADWYSAADLFCLASLREGCPNGVLEAMACGAPVLAADVGGIAEILPPACGRVLAPASSEDFAAGIARALERQWDRDEIARRGAARAWPQVAAEVLEYYERRGLR